MLFIILVVRRTQALFTLSVDNIVFKENKVILLPNKTMKHTKANRPLESLIYHHYSDNEKLCIVKCLQSYIGIRNTLVTRDIRDLIISYGKPHKPVSSETISRWIKDELSKAGVDTSVSKAHGWRSASSSKAGDAGIFVSEILEKGGWKSVQTFKTFYYRGIINSEDVDFELSYVSPILYSK